MTLTKTLTLMTAVAVLSLAATSAFADQRGGGRARGGSVSRGAAVARPGGRVGAVAPRGGAYPVYRGGGVASPGFYRPYYAFRPRVSLGFGLWLGYPVSYPYYYYGSPYGYPYRYPDPYAYGYGYPARSYGYPAPYPPPAYPPSNYPPSNYPSSGYPGYASTAPAYPTQSAPGSVSVQPGAQPAGGVSFEITPNTAAVFVDGTFVGSVAQFGPMSAPLGLLPGRHHIEVRASGYQTMTFEADVTAGQVTPYQGTLQVQRNY